MTNEEVLSHRSRRLAITMAARFRRRVCRLTKRYLGREMGGEVLANYTEIKAVTTKL